MKRSTSGTTTQCSPQLSASRRAERTSGVSAITGTRGRSRAASSAVVPECEKQQIAFTFVVSATSRAATVIASDTPDRPTVRCASITWR